MRGINHAEDFGWSNALRFGGGGGGTTTSTQTQKADPWAGLQPYLTGGQVVTSGDPNQGAAFGGTGAATSNTVSNVPGLFPEAARLYQTGAPQYYPGGTYVPLNAGQQAALSKAYDIGMSGGTPTLQQGAAANQFGTSPGYTAQTQGTFNAVNPTIAGVGSGSYLGLMNPAAAQGQGYLSNMIGGAGLMPTLPAALQNQGLLSQEIGGAYLNPATDPGFQNVINTTLANTMPAISAPFAAAGRSDSGLASRAMGQGVSDAIGGLTLQNYLAERQNQIGAGQQASGNLLAEQGLQQNAAGQAASNLGTALNATLGAGGLASQNLLGQQGQQVQMQALAPTLDQTQIGDIQTALQAAGMNQQDIQNYVNSQIQQWNYNQMLPWNQLQLYSNILQSQGMPGSTITGQTQQPYFSNQGANIMSGIGAAASVAASVAAII